MDYEQKTVQWWKPMGLEEAESQGDFWKYEPVVGPLPKKPWVIGQARPFATLPVGAALADTTAAVAAVLGFIAVQRVWLGGVEPLFVHFPSAVQFMAGLSFTVVPEAVGATLGALAARVPGSEGVRRAGAVGVASAVRSGYRLGSGFAKIGLVAARMAKSMAGGAVDDPHMSEFEWVKRNDGYDRRLAQAQSMGLDKMTEVGSWRFANDMMSDGRPEWAARAWFAKPFNPDWHVAGRGKMIKGKPFRQALSEIAHAGGVSDPLKLRYLWACVEAMPSAAESVELRHAVGSEPEGVTQPRTPKRRI